MNLTNEEMQEITGLAEKQLRLEQEVVEAQDRLTALNEQLEKVRDDLLPQAMARVGMKKFTLLDGSSITIKDEIFASIRSGKIEAAAAWLDEIGCGDALKDEVNVKFARGQVDLSKKVLALAAELGVTATEKLSVHAMTLKALIREQREKGREFPEDLFAIHDKQKAVIKGGSK